MGVAVRVGDDQDIDRALRVFHAKLRRDYERQWYKRRYGYYEKPSELRRKRKKMERLRRGETNLTRGSLKLFIGEKELWQRTGSTMAAGK